MIYTWSEQDHLECAPFGILGHIPRNEVVGSQGVYTFCFYGNFKRNLLIKVTLFTEVLLSLFHLTATALCCGVGEPWLSIFLEQQKVLASGFFYSE